MGSIGDLILEISAAQGVDPRLAVEVAIQESGLNPNAISPAGAIGIFQLMPATAEALGVNPYSVEENILGGIRYLAQQLSTFPDISQALAAYNWGPENVTRAVTRWGPTWLDHAPAETQDYVSAILGRLGTAAASVEAPHGLPLLGLIAAASVALYFLLDST